MKQIYVFVDSERPDQYINSIVHCVLERDVRKVAFIHIRSLTSSEARRENHGLSARISAAVQAQIENLAERQEYLIRVEGRADTRADLNKIYGEHRAAELAAYYRRIRELPISFSNQEIEYSELRRTLSEIAREGADAFIDITAIKKRYLGDIVAAGLVEGIRGLWTFELLGAATDFERPWRMLIHDLRDDSGPTYRYTNVLDTETYKSCVRLVFIRGSCPAEWCTSRDFCCGWTRAQLTTADNRAV